MAQDKTKKEALFNEVKGSLFEFLVGKEISILSNQELLFLQSIDKNYLTVLSQQDRMVRQFYPEILPFLHQASKILSVRLIEYLKEKPHATKVVGKLSHSVLSSQLQEADLILYLKSSIVPLSLKLNKKNAFVNTKSGGIKSFFSQYFSFIPLNVQESFNKFVDLEFGRMSYELHSHHELDYTGNFNGWVDRGFSELPGELDIDSRQILKKYYSRIAEKMHHILSNAKDENPSAFTNSFPSLMGFGTENILQAIYFHDFPANLHPVIEIHSFKDIFLQLDKLDILPFNSTSSVDFRLGLWTFQIRVKPMNKFTTTAIKINCSLKFNRPSSSF